LAKPVKQQQEGTTTAKPAVASAYADFAEALAGNPLLAQSTAAMAAATAVGMSIAGQFAGAFFGALQGALEAQNRLTASPARPEAPGPEPEAVASVPAVAPVGKPKTKKTAASETAERPVKALSKSGATKPVSRSGTTRPAARRPAKAAASDDLKQIAGIGPKLEKVLNAQGITRVSQIAAWKEADVAKFDDALGLDGRIRRDDWVGQARKLAK
jgi:Uncharacterized conserved protein